MNKKRNDERNTERTLPAVERRNEPFGERDQVVRSLRRVSYFLPLLSRGFFAPLSVRRGSKTLRTARTNYYWVRRVMHTWQFQLQHVEMPNYSGENGEIRP